MGKYFKNLLISIDQLGNTLTGGDPDETISSRMGKWLGPKKASACWLCSRISRIVCWGLDKLDSDHCRNSIDFTEGDDDLLA